MYFFMLFPTRNDCKTVAWCRSAIQQSSIVIIIDDTESTTLTMLLSLRHLDKDPITGNSANIPVLHAPS